LPVEKLRPALVTNETVVLQTVVCWKTYPPLDTTACLQECNCRLFSCPSKYRGTCIWYPPRAVFHTGAVPVRASRRATLVHTRAWLP